MPWLHLSQTVSIYSMLQLSRFFARSMMLLLQWITWWSLIFALLKRFRYWQSPWLTSLSCFSIRTQLIQDWSVRCRSAAIARWCTSTTLTAWPLSVRLYCWHFVFVNNCNRSVSTKSFFRRSYCLCDQNLWPEASHLKLCPNHLNQSIPTKTAKTMISTSAFLGPAASK